MVIMFGNVKAQPAKDNKEGARVFVQKFYDEYLKIYSARGVNKDRTYIDATDYIITYKPQFFVDTLLTALKENENHGGIFFPFLSPWAIYEQSKYQTGKVKEDGVGFFIDVHAGLIGKVKQNTVDNPLAVIVRVMNINNHWKIVDFYYPSPNSTGDTKNLLGEIRRQKIATEEFLKNPRISE